jgi:hypothetical protein
MLKALEGSVVGAPLPDRVVTTPDGTTASLAETLGRTLGYKGAMLTHRLRDVAIGEADGCLVNTTERQLPFTR